MEDPGGAVLPLSEQDRTALLWLARRAIECHFLGAAWPEPEEASAAVSASRGCFVTLRQRDSNELRGCRGECPARRPLYDAVRRMAVASAMDDPRFVHVTEKEFHHLRIGINALGPLFLIEPDAVEVGRHGLLILSPSRAGLLLPEVPITYGWDLQTYLEGLCRKAGIRERGWQDADTQLFAFESESWWEPDAPQPRPGTRSRLTFPSDRSGKPA